MKTIVRSRLMTLFAVILAVMSFMTIFFGFNAVKANPEEVSITEATVNIVNGAEIKTKGNSGIRFTASVSAKDFSGLKAKYGAVEYGIIIAPTDFVISEETFKIGGWQYAENDNVTEYVEGSNVSGKLYQRATVVPVLNNGEYVFKGAFVNIATENYDRDFSVRAYVKVEGADPVYSDVVTRSVFTVANGVLANGSMADDADGLKYVKDVDKAVYDKYTTCSVTYENLTEGKEKTDKPVAGDTISFVTTLSDGTKTLTAKPIISKYGDYMTENVDADGNFDGTYTVNKSEDFGVMATMCSSYSSFTVNGLGDDNPTILVDCKQTTLEVEDITLENSAVGQKWEGFFTKKNNGTISVISQAIEDDDISAAALATCPTGEDVYVIDNPSWVDDKITLGVDMKEKLLNKYVSFKYYNYGYSYQNTSWSINEVPSWKGSVNNLTSNGSVGRFVMNTYEQEGNNVGDLSDYWPYYNAYKGTWCTVEMSIITWFNDMGSGISVHTDKQGATTVYPKLFVSDFKVSNVPLSEMYSDLEVRVEDTNGGEIVENDELVLNAYAMPLGGSEKVKVNAAITTTEGAMEEGIYKGNGDFTVTAKAYGMTATKDVVAVKTQRKVAVATNYLSVYPTNNENVTFEKVTSGAPEGAPSGAEVIKVHYVLNEKTYAEDSQEVTNDDRGALQISNDAIYAGCYLTFKHYVDSAKSSKLMMFNYTFIFNKTGIVNGPTNCVITQFDDSGNIVNSDNLSSYKGKWVNIQVYFPEIPAEPITIWQFKNAYNSPAADLYIADIAVQNYASYVPAE